MIDASKLGNGKWEMVLRHTSNSRRLSPLDCFETRSAMQVMSNRLRRCIGISALVSFLTVFSCVNYFIFFLPSDSIPIIFPSALAARDLARNHTTNLIAPPACQVRSRKARDRWRFLFFIFARKTTKTSHMGRHWALLYQSPGRSNGSPWGENGRTSLLRKLFLLVPRPSRGETPHNNHADSRDSRVLLSST